MTPDAHGDAARSSLDAVYPELRGLAGRFMAGERREHTLQPTALVHEAWLRLVERGDVAMAELSGFHCAAALAMRRILVDHARARAREKRGGGRERVPITSAELGAEGRDPVDLVALDDALAALDERDSRKARVVELRFFAGLSVEETAQALEVSQPTVKREWALARAWLLRRLDGEAAS